MFDVDGPLFLDNTPEFFAWANQQDEIEKPWDYSVHIATGDWPAATGIPRQQTHLLFKRFCESAGYPGTEVTPGAAAAMKQLGDFSKCVATARGELLRCSTIYTLTNALGEFDSYLFEVHWEKVGLAIAMTAHYVIDDNYHVLEEVARQSQAQPILFPARVPRDAPSSNGVVVLEAERLVTDSMSREEFKPVCKQAWAEITNIVLNP